MKKSKSADVLAEPEIQRHSVATAENDLRVARFAKKIVNAYDFFDLEPTVLCRLAALPGETAATLTPDFLSGDCLCRGCTGTGVRSAACRRSGRLRRAERAEARSTWAAAAGGPRRQQRARPRQEGNTASLHSSKFIVHPSAFIVVAPPICTLPQGVLKF